MSESAVRPTTKNSRHQLIIDTARDLAEAEGWGILRFTTRVRA